MYPRLVINLKKLKQNLDAVAGITKDRGGCSLMIVTKGLCADKEYVKLVAEHEKVDYMADSRIQNLPVSVEGSAAHDGDEVKALEVKVTVVCLRRLLGGDRALACCNLHAQLIFEILVDRAGCSLSREARDEVLQEVATVQNVRASLDYPDPVIEDRKSVV